MSEEGCGSSWGKCEEREERRWERGKGWAKKKEISADSFMSAFESSVRERLQGDKTLHVDLITVSSSARSVS